MANIGDRGIQYGRTWFIGDAGGVQLLSTHPTTKAISSPSHKYLRVLGSAISERR